MANDKIKIELHLIQNFAPSCLNRDDANAPKDCEFGGVRRARISSQCMKRSERLRFRDTGSADTGKRTKLIKKELVDLLKAAGRPQELTAAAVDVFVETYYSKADSKKPEHTAVLLYVAKPEIAQAVACIEESWDQLTAFVAEREKAGDKKAKKGSTFKRDEKIAKRLEGAGLSADIALFGRMLAENPEMKAHAAVQVAHAISTHRVDMDFDFFTAVDDLNPESDTGAGMMGETGFNSACFYRYALIDRNQLVENLGGDAVLADKVIRAFLEASVFAIPTGKQNSFAAQNPPDFGMIVVKKNGFPCSLANAFAQPVRIKSGVDEDLVGLSIGALCELQPKVKGVYGEGGIVGKGESLWHLGHERRLGSLKANDCGSFVAALDAAMVAVAAAAEA